MSNDIRFDGKVAIITGAGNGLGKAYAIAFAARGAKVVVNDLGGSRTGEGKSAKAADSVVAEIRQAGGTAVANYDSVVDGAKIVQTALDNFGRVDIVVNNAGILRDVSFHKMQDKDWKLLQAVHLNGSYAVTRAAWPHMRKQKYGRIIMVASAAGLYGNFGQAHYSAVKMGLTGFSNTLAREGAKRNIHCNTIAPMAGSRMTETVMPPDLVKALKPEYVVPLVQYLCHDSCEETGGVFEVGAGWVSKLRWERTKGKVFAKNFTAESVANSWDAVTDFTDADHPSDPQESFGVIMEGLASQPDEEPTAERKSSSNKAGKSDAVDVELAMAHKMEPMKYEYTDYDSICYALGVGAATDPLDQSELKFAYENHPEFCALPTFGVVIPFGALAKVMGNPGLKFNPMMLLHGEQYMEIKKPLPTSGSFMNYPRISGVYDKKKGALVTLDVTTKDEQGEDILFNQFSVFIRGIGGFGGDKGPRQPDLSPPNRPPDVVQTQRTLDNQALLYRLSGDTNPLHADPNMAAMGNFDRPILHGLCSFGYAARAVLKNFANNDVSKFKSIRVRFVKHVFPGETLVTEMWQTSPTRILFRVKVAERGDYVLSNCEVRLFGDDGAATETKAAPASAPAASAGGFKAAAVFEQMKGLMTADMVKKVQVVYRFDITNGEGKTRSWLVDLKNGSGKLEESKGKADCSFAMKDDDFVGLMSGKLNPQMAFMQGKLKIKGNMMLAQKLSLLQPPKSKL